jgi:hypothetical protein
MSTATDGPAMLTPAELADRWRVDVHAILLWLRNGSLRGVNLARSASSKKPRWRIPLSSVQQFEAARTNGMTEKPKTGKDPKRKRVYFP